MLMTGAIQECGCNESASLRKCAATLFANILLTDEPDGTPRLVRLDESLLLSGATGSRQDLNKVFRILKRDELLPQLQKQSEGYEEDQLITALNQKA